MIFERNFLLFEFCLSMFPTKPPRARDVLSLVDKYASHSPDRSTAYLKASRKSGVSVAALRSAASRAGKEKPRRSLKCAFSEEEEDLLEAVCVLYARRGKPLSYNDFIDIATKFAKRDEEHRFSRIFVKEFVRRHESVLRISSGKIT